MFSPTHFPSPISSGRDLPVFLLCGKETAAGGIKESEKGGGIISRKLFLALLSLEYASKGLEVSLETQDMASIESG